MSEDFKNFNINIDDIPMSNELFDNIHKAINELRKNEMYNNLEVVLNDNLINVKDKLRGYRTIFGCRVSYDNLEESVSFIVRKDTEPSYEQLKDRINKAIEYIGSREIYNDDFDTETNKLLALLKGDKEW